ncbi:hypothetical protein GALMADRAFT_232042 [Galerina marginata CBS 339.88]|uniref:Uncharacterized protein n=1 Tax=Galerina marginata (strain CBS 339.88) TaxID=685588 RepID=A0A067SBL8_GALM3|nr:hypothetical protein GALMADRAFT_232042 [Galerina marginata CBS 339.88]
MLNVPAGHRPSVSSRFSLIAYDAQTWTSILSVRQGKQKGSVRLGAVNGLLLRLRVPALMSLPPWMVGAATVFRSTVWQRLSPLEWTSRPRLTIYLQDHSSTSSSTEHTNNNPAPDVHASFAVAVDAGAQQDDICGLF